MRITSSGRMLMKVPVHRKCAMLNWIPVIPVLVLYMMCVVCATPVKGHKVDLRQINPCKAEINGMVLNLEALAKSDGEPRFEVQYEGWTYTFNPCSSYNLPNDPHEGLGDQCHYVSMCKWRESEQGNEYYTLGIQRNARFYARRNGAKRNDQHLHKKHVHIKPEIEEENKLLDIPIALPVNIQNSSQSKLPYKHDLQGFLSDAPESSFIEETFSKLFNDTSLESSESSEEINGTSSEEVNGTSSEDGGFSSSEEGGISSSEEIDNLSNYTANLSLPSQNNSNTGDESGKSLNKLSNVEDFTMRRKEESQRRNTRSIILNVLSDSKLVNLREKRYIEYEKKEIPEQEDDDSDDSNEEDEEDENEEGEEEERDAEDDEHEHRAVDIHFILKFKGIRSQKHQRSLIYVVCDMKRTHVEDALFLLRESQENDMMFELHHRCCCPGHCVHGLELGSTIPNTTEHLSAKELRFKELEAAGPKYMWLIIVANAVIILTAILIATTFCRKGGMEPYNALPG